MLDARYPFTVEQVKYHLSKLFTGEALLGAVAGVITVILNHVAMAPPLWKGLAITSVVFMLTDIVTGYLRARTTKRPKYCDGECHPVDAVQFNSRDLGATFTKFIAYGVVFIVSTFTDVALTFMQLVPKQFYLVAVGALGAITSRELLSNWENLRAVFRNIHEPFPFDGVERLTSRVVHAVTDRAASESDTVADVVEPEAHEPRD